MSFALSTSFACTTGEIGDAAAGDDAADLYDDNFGDGPDAFNGTSRDTAMAAYCAGAEEDSRRVPVTCLTRWDVRLGGGKSVKDMEDTFM